MDKSKYEDLLNMTVINAISKLKNMDLPPNPAIIFDIDDTLINTDESCKTQIIILYNYALHMKITPIIITSRVGYDVNIEFTNKQLFDCRIFGYKYIYFRPNEWSDSWKYKEQSRKNVIERGYNIVMSVGDMPWDIGRYGGVGVIVPRMN